MLIVSVDVDYRDDLAVAAAVCFRGWSATEVEHTAVLAFRDVAPYKPGEFYKRELPCLLGVLGRVPRADVVVVDGYVWLDQGRAGLGAHLHAALHQTIVIGVAKTRYAGATGAAAICRGRSRVPLYVTAAGVDFAQATRWIQEMHGPHRISTMLKYADRLARTATPSTDDRR
jgi:deoxyribonuclease V